MKSTVKTVFDYVDRARAEDVYIKLLPAVSLYTQIRSIRKVMIRLTAIKNYIVPN